MNNLAYLSMDIQQAISIYQMAQPTIQYEQCNFCRRQFFKGKLKFHQKHCTENQPMVHSPLKTHKQQQKKLIIDLNKDIFRSEEKKCKFCSMKLPLFLFTRHEEKCQISLNSGIKPQNNQDQDVRKSITQMGFKNKQQHKLPFIKNRGSPSPQKFKKAVIKQTYEVKIRQELRCFRKAEEIKQIQCPACNRIFSKEASLRHIPICQSLKLKQKLSIALKKRQKNASHILKVTNEHTKKRNYRSVVEQNNQKQLINEFEGIVLNNPQSYISHKQQYN